MSLTTNIARALRSLGVGEPNRKGKPHKKKSSGNKVAQSSSAKFQRGKKTKISGKNVILKKYPQDGRSPTREGKGMVNATVKQGTRHSIREVHNDYADTVLNNSIGRNSETIEDIVAPVNPYILFQYVAGVVLKTMASNERYQDYNTALSAINYYVSNMHSIGSITTTTVWPRAIVELAWALTPRRVGKYNYSPHWAPTLAAVNNVANQGFQFQNSGFDAHPATGTVTAGYLVMTSSSNGIPPISEVNFNAWQDANFKTLDLVNIEEMERFDNKNDASAFCFDTAGGHAFVANTNSALSLITMIGYNTGVPQYLNVSSVAGLETPIRRPSLGALRLCTPIATYGAASFHDAIICVQRLPRSTIAVSCAPSTLGYQRVTPAIRGKVQVKWVPGTGTMTAMLQRLEMVTRGLVNYIDGEAWTAAFALGDVQNLVVGIYKDFLRRYSGSTIGVRGVIPSGSFYDCEPYHQCFATASLSSIRLSEYVQKLLGTQTPYVDADGTLLPFVAALQAPTSINTYSGSVAYPASPTSAQFGLATALQTVVAVYKSFESVMVQRENMRLYGQVGKTKLDVSFIRDSNADRVGGLVSRREITPDFLSDALLLSNAISYDIAQISVGSTPDNPSAFNHSYRQHHRKFFSGFDTNSVYNTITKFDGMVLDALTSNMSDAAGPDTQPNARGALLSSSPVSLDVAGRNVGLIARYANRLLPRAGNYCGPGWTAGVDTAAVSPLLRDGKYIVKPTSDEDAICKVHDEAYREAAGDAKKVRSADYEMVKSLRELRREKGLSTYGFAAELAIASKAGLASLSEDGVRDYFGAY